ncbi:MAG: acetamidase, partial [Proteobacteria bacterium]
MTTITFQHSIHAAHHHWSWDRNLEPVLRVDPGATVRIELNDPGGGQIHAASMAGDLLHLDFSRVNPVTGPLFVNGAESGDTISLEIVDIEPCGWGWSALIPGFGLLADEFREPYLVHWNYDKSGSMPAVLHDAGRVPLNPMVGAIGLAPAAPGPHDILPPRRVGGTMDIRDITRG